MVPVDVNFPWIKLTLKKSSIYLPSCDAEREMRKTGLKKDPLSRTEVAKAVTELPATEGGKSFLRPSQSPAFVIYSQSAFGLLNIVAKPIRAASTSRQEVWTPPPG